MLKFALEVRRFFLFKIVLMLQKPLLWASYTFFKLMPFKLKPVRYVIGTSECASYLKNLSMTLDSCISCSLDYHPAYTHSYDFDLTKLPRPLQLFARYIVSPILLGYLLNKADAFIYFWKKGFLTSKADQREYEFSFVKSKGKKLVCFFLGNDIRSPKKQKENGEKYHREVSAHYYHYQWPERETEDYEKLKLRIAQVADRYADEIFTSELDQASYLERTPIFPPYFLNPDFVCDGEKKFANPDIIRIVHAPSAPVLKGTQIVRSSIRRLQKEGYKFEYIELQKVTNDQVLKTLRDSHIVLNEFFSFVPGQFGIEAMASSCALMTSADPSLEPGLASGEGAWFVTPSYYVYENLKQLLDDPELMNNYRKAGHRWVQEFCAKERIRGLFQDTLGF